MKLSPEERVLIVEEERIRNHVVDFSIISDWCILSEIRHESTYISIPNLRSQYVCEPAP